MRFLSYPLLIPFPPVLLPPLFHLCTFAPLHCLLPLASPVSCLHFFTFAQRPRRDLHLCTVSRLPPSPPCPPNTRHPTPASSPFHFCTATPSRFARLHCYLPSPLPLSHLRIGAVFIGSNISFSEPHPKDVKRNDHEDAHIAAVVAALGALGYRKPENGDYTQCKYW